MNTATNFERVVEAYIVGFKESGSHAADIYSSTLLGARAFIYTILTTQAICYASSYTDAEVATMYELRENVMSEGFTEVGFLAESINFLHSLIGR